MPLVQAFLNIAILYFIPGIITSRLTSGKLKNNPFWWVLLSYVVVPFLYIILIYLNKVNLITFLILLCVYSVSILLATKLFHVTALNLDKIFLNNSASDTNRWLKILTILVSLIFFLLLMTPRWGLWNRYVPVGDDKPRVGQVLSVAASSNNPRHFRLPTTEMSIYYYHLIQPGLLTRFSENIIKVNESWFIHLFISYALFVWFIRAIVAYFGRTSLEKLVMTLGLTFLGGLEYYLAKIKGVNQDHLEWWTDWLGKQFYIHMQLSSPFTSYFWVTQHVFPMLLIFLAYFILNSPESSKKIAWFFLGLISAAILGNSAFVFMAFALAYFLYYLIRLVIKKENLSQVLKMNLFIWALFSLLSLNIFQIFLNSGKENYFFFHASVFYFFKNEGLLKLINFLLTIPTYLFVELGFLFFVYLYYLYLFIRKKILWEKSLFLYLLTIPLFLIFIFRAKGDNNFSMRAVLPALSVLAIFSGWLVGDIWQKYAITKVKKIFLSFVLIILTASQLPSAIWEFSGRYEDQFEYSNPVFAEIDKKLPLNAIVFADVESLKDESLKNLHDSLTHEAHRLTFKPVPYFNITDKEYTTQKAKDKYDGNHFAYMYEVEDLLKNEPELRKYPIYYISINEYKLEKVLVDKSFNVYKIN